MKITYLDNSGFCLNKDDVIMIFDYYNEKPNFGISNISNGIITDEIINSKEKVYFFTSHSHLDHYNPCIFNFANDNSKIKYILDSGIDKKIDNNNVHFLKKGESFNDENIKVKAFDSTDIGISFLIDINGYKIFHAGDFNFWHWRNEADDEYVLAEKKKFLDIVEKIQEECRHIDLIFFPVDYRMGDDGDLGAKIMLERFKPKMFIPMHFRNDFACIMKFKEENCEYNIWDIKKRGDVLDFL